MTPGHHQQHDLAGALDLATGERPHDLGPRHTNARCRARLARLEVCSPPDQSTRLEGVVDPSTIHDATASARWLAAHPRVTRHGLPTSGLRANPREPACGEVQDLGTRHPPRRRLRDLVAAVTSPLQLNGPWPDKRSARYAEPAVTAAVENLAVEPHGKIAACVYQTPMY